MALNEDVSSSDEKNSPNNNANIDAEAGNRGKYGSSNVTAGGRIAPVLPHLSNYDFGDDSGSDILGKQIELEADNAIKYRTCSWQKVRFGENVHNSILGQILTMAHRLRRYCSRNIFAWPSCLFHGRTAFSASFRVSF